MTDTPEPGTVGELMTGRCECGHIEYAHRILGFRECTAVDPGNVECQCRAFTPADPVLAELRHNAATCSSTAAPIGRSKGSRSTSPTGTATRT